MATFNQQGQNVTNQNNAGRDINIGTGQSAEDIITTLEFLKKQLAQAKDKGILDEETSTDAEYQVTKALQQAKNPDPDKKTILDNLNVAKGLLEDAAAAGGLVTAVVNAVEIVRRMF